MRGGWLFGCALLVGSTTLSIGAAAASNQRTQAAPAPDYRLQMSDTIEIGFPFSPEYNQTVTVQPDGRISLREAPQIMASGQTLHDLEGKIAEAYRGILLKPEVSVVLKDFQKPSFFASGEVGHPGRYELRSSTSLLQALSEAGGILQDRAKRSNVVIFRPQPNGTYEVLIVDLKAKLDSRVPIEQNPILSGDVIYVPQNKFSKVSRFVPSANMGAYLAPGF